MAHNQLGPGASKQLPCRSHGSSRFQTSCSHPAKAPHMMPSLWLQTTTLYTMSQGVLGAYSTPPGVASGLPQGQGSSCMVPQGAQRAPGGWGLPWPSWGANPQGSRFTWFSFFLSKNLCFCTNLPLEHPIGHDRDPGATIHQAGLVSHHLTLLFHLGISHGLQPTTQRFYVDLLIHFLSHIVWEVPYRPTLKTLCLAHPSIPPRRGHQGASVVTSWAQNDSVWTTWLHFQVPSAPRSLHTNQVPKAHAPTPPQLAQ